MNGHPGYVRSSGLEAGSWLFAVKPDLAGVPRMFFFVRSSARGFAGQSVTYGATATIQTDKRSQVVWEMSIIFPVVILLTLTPAPASGASTCFSSSGTPASQLSWRAVLPSFPSLARHATSAAALCRRRNAFAVSPPPMADARHVMCGGIEHLGAGLRPVSAGITRQCHSRFRLRPSTNRAGSVLLPCSIKTSCNLMGRQRSSRFPLFVGLSNATPSLSALQSCCLMNTSGSPVTARALFSSTHSDSCRRGGELPGRGTQLFSSLPVDIGNEFPFRASTRTAGNREPETLIYFDNAATTQKPRRVLQVRTARRTSPHQLAGNGDT